VVLVPNRNQIDPPINRDGDKEARQDDGSEFALVVNSETLAMGGKVVLCSR
jgi:hypothetical protein